MCCFRLWWKVRATEETLRVRFVDPGEVFLVRRRPERSHLLNRSVLVRCNPQVQRRIEEAKNKLTIRLIIVHATQTRGDRLHAGRIVLDIGNGSGRALATAGCLAKAYLFVAYT